MKLWSDSGAALRGAVVAVLVACAPALSGAAQEEPAPREGGGRGQICGTIVGLPCAQGMFCEFPAGECDTHDNAGRCVEVPEACTRQWEPVCSCPSAEHASGRTHGNDCERRATLEQKAHDGECTTPKP